MYVQNRKCQGVKSSFFDLFLDVMLFCTYTEFMPAKDWRKDDSLDKRIEIRVSADERNLFLRASKKAGCSVSAWLRKLALAEADTLLKSKKT
jgi:hypothetical protein